MRRPTASSGRKAPSSKATTASAMGMSTPRWRGGGATPRGPTTTATLLASAALVASTSTSPVFGLYLSNLSVRLPHNPSTKDTYMMSHVFPPVAGSRSGSRRSRPLSTRAPSSDPLTMCAVDN